MNGLWDAFLFLGLLLGDVILGLVILAIFALIIAVIAYAINLARTNNNE